MALDVEPVLRNRLHPPACTRNGSGHGCDGVGVTTDADGSSDSTLEVGGKQEGVEGDRDGFVGSDPVAQLRGDCLDDCTLNFHRIQYSVPGHVIGGSEPDSWETARNARKEYRVAYHEEQPLPKRSGPIVNSRFDAECWWCGKAIRTGEPIALVEFKAENRWLHQRCTRAN